MGYITDFCLEFPNETLSPGLLGGSAVEHLSLAQVVIPGSGTESTIGLPAWSLLLPLPVSPPLPLSVCLMNK